MKLYKNTKWYNPFYVDVNNKSYELNKIYFFNKDGIICSTRSGWFGSGDNNFNSLEIPCSCSLKKKVDFNYEFAFIVFSGEKSWDGVSKYELYIPSDVLSVNGPIIDRKSDRYYVIKWLTNIDGVYCDLWHFIDGKLTEIEHKINNVGEKLSNMYQSQYADLPKYIEVLNKLNEERNKEVENIKNIDDESILSLYRK
jgi:hypothetical protein